MFKIWNYNGKIAYEDVIEAPQDFDISYCIGTGGYDSVYRAKLSNGRDVSTSVHHVVNEKCDVYSFGVVAVETISGSYPGGFVKSMARQLGENDVSLQDFLDKRLPPPTDQILASNVVQIVGIALSFLNPDPKH
ncbi:hypothetical protein Salat_2158100 [Sesamum alatum]|uniref:non-specific serine/threonine protein kinase n=1 Tax=Sesamum alatum TaxID=300844 RepID=A0AAE2CHA1_9LAMI|nr:hypothetical protein Salat_2158100 [Sesamum alatum]